MQTRELRDMRCCVAESCVVRAAFSTVAVVVVETNLKQAFQPSSPAPIALGLAAGSTPEGVLDLNLHGDVPKKNFVHPVLEFLPSNDTQF